MLFLQIWKEHFTQGPSLLSSNIQQSTSWHIFKESTHVRGTLWRYFDNNDVGWSWQEERERDLKTRYWWKMLEGGSTTEQFLWTRKSAFNIIEPLIKAANKWSSVLLQDEQWICAGVSQQLLLDRLLRNSFQQCGNLWHSVKIYFIITSCSWQASTTWGPNESFVLAG